MPHKDPEARRRYQREWRRRFGKENDRARYQRRAAQFIAQGLTTQGKARKVRAPFDEDRRRERNRHYARAYYERQRATARRILGDACRVCGAIDADVLQFDHVNGDGYLERRKHGGRRANRISWSVLLSELDQFGLAYVLARWQLLCALCHARKTLGEARERARAPMPEPEPRQRALPF